ncbi:MAG TPA: helix-turn-helix domain-containing protein [Phycisphaerae bacterium]|nr:helix-turn-helix domain-containing protein [Phycisphaerae bacterium]
MPKYYTLEQVQDRLGLNEERVKQLVQTGQLREFRDAGKVVYQAEEVDNLASKQGSGEISLEPVEEEDAGRSAAGLTGSDVISLEEVDDLESKGGTRAGAKDDTVITSVGISVFDDEELASAAAADPMAKTQISKQSAEPEIPLDSVGSSGSGLLDLTRESDDTSLGAELLDEIYPEEEETISEEPVAAQTPEGSAGGTFLPHPVAPAVVPLASAAMDPLSPAFTGLAVVSVVLLGLVGVTSAAVIQGVWPSFLDLLYQNTLFFLIGAVVLAALGLLIGWLVGKQASRPVAVRRSPEPEAEQD